MKYTVDPWNNFCRVFELPKRYPEDYCFNGGHPVNFQMIDWFNPCPGMPRPAVSKEVWEKEVGPVKGEEREVDYQELSEELVEFLQSKDYTMPGVQYLIICDFGMTVVFTGENSNAKV